MGGTGNVPGKDQTCVRKIGPEVWRKKDASEKIQSRWLDNIKEDLKATECKIVDKIYLFQNRDAYCTPVNTVLTFRVFESRKISLVAERLLAPYDWPFCMELITLPSSKYRDNRFFRNSWYLYSAVHGVTCQKFLFLVGSVCFSVCPEYWDIMLSGYSEDR
jgi:hypothetical protein